MTKNEDNILDWRSTGRRKARRALFAAYVPYKCAGYIMEAVGEEIVIPCGKTSKEPPKDAPTWFEEIWPKEKRVLTQLQADHETKDVTQNDIEHLNWRCPTCHKFQDQKTDKGERTTTKAKQWIED